MSEEIAEIIGIDEVCRWLDEAPREIALQSFLKAGQAGAEVIVANLEPRTPIQLVASGGDLVVEGGDLQGAIVTEVTLDSQGRGVVVNVGFGKLGYVARFVEMGHHMIGHKPEKKKLGEVPPHPFMRPAAAAAADPAIAAVATSIQDSVRELFPQAEL